MAVNTNKELKLYYSISEVAAQVGVSETLLRYWEREFPSIRPKKSGRNIRKYSREDIEQVKIVYNLLKVKGLKISAAREAIKANHKGVSNTAEVVSILTSVREELLAIRKELDFLE